MGRVRVEDAEGNQALGELQVKLDDLFGDIMNSIDVTAIQHIDGFELSARQVTWIGVPADKRDPTMWIVGRLRDAGVSATGPRCPTCKNAMRYQEQSQGPGVWLCDTRACATSPGGGAYRSKA